MTGVGHGDSIAPMRRILLAALPFLLAVPAGAEDAACPDAMATGSNDVQVEGKQASRARDRSACAGTAVQGSSDVLINGQPALTVGSTVACANGKTGIVVGGASSVFINGKPMAGAGARIVGCE